MTEATTLTWFESDPDRRAHEQDRVISRFPQFTWGERLYPRRHAFWRGELQPFPSLDHLDAIAGHLAVQGPIYVGPRGELSVDATLARPVHVPLGVGLTETFLVELIYREPPKTPLIYALHPRIDKGTYPDHPHLLAAPHPLLQRTGFGPTHSLCVFAPHDNEWSWETGTAATVLSWTAMWLGAHLIWLARGRNEADWLTPGAPHDPRVLIETVPPGAPCPCGSGLEFGRCCAGRARRLALSTRRPGRLHPPEIHQHYGRPPATHLK